jgi:hypothetical protein
VEGPGGRVLAAGLNEVWVRPPPPGDRLPRAPLTAGWARLPAAGSLAVPLPVRCELTAH